MSRNIFFIADLHLNHEKLVTGFEPGKPGPRGEFGCIEGHDEAIIQFWNSVVRPQDKIYVLGDVALSKRGLEKVARLNGHKRLVMCNHDQELPAVYGKYFEKIAGAKTLDGMLLTHIPVHQSQLSRRSMQVNVHGHLHEEVLWAKSRISVAPFPNPLYLCVSCEQIDYTPIEYSQVRAYFGDLLKDTP